MKLMATSRIVIASAFTCLNRSAAWTEEFLTVCLAAVNLKKIIADLKEGYFSKLSCK